MFVFNSEYARVYVTSCALPLPPLLRDLIRSASGPNFSDWKAKPLRDRIRFASALNFSSFSAWKENFSHKAKHVTSRMYVLIWMLAINSEHARVYVTSFAPPPQGWTFSFQTKWFMLCVKKFYGYSCNQPANFGWSCFAGKWNVKWSQSCNKYQYNSARRTYWTQWPYYYTILTFKRFRNKMNQM